VDPIRQANRLAIEPREYAYDASVVAYGGQYRTTCTWEAADDMWAFDMSTRSWTLVVPPTPVPPSLRDLTARGAPASPGPGRSPWIPAEKVMLHGGPFFTRLASLADEPWASTPPAAARSVADGLFLSECRL
jgi:hypothetical protein